MTDELNLTPYELSEKMKPKFPLCSPVAVCLAEESKLSGVEYTKAFREAVAETIGAKEEPKPSNRKRSARLSIWITPDQKKYIDWRIARSGRYGSATDFIAYLIDRDVRETGYREKYKRKQRPEVEAPNAAKESNPTESLAQKEADVNVVLE